MALAELHVYNAANATKLSELTLSDDGPTRIQGGDELNGVGRIRVELQADHINAGDVTVGNVLRLLDGTNLLHAYTITRVEEVQVTDNEADKVLRVDGRGLLDRWAWSTVEPWIDGRPISLDRVWNWTSPSLDLTSWGDAYSRPGVDREWNQLPDAWPVAPEFNSWIWSNSSTPGSPPWTTPEATGESLFRNSFTLASAATVVFYVAGNGNWEVWLDSTLLAREPVLYPELDRYEATWRYVVSLSAGTHHFAMKCDKQGPGLSGIVAACFEVDTDRIGDAVWSSAGAPSYNWKTKHLPSTFPGFTAPEILQELLDEAQARSELTGWTINAVGSFDEIEEFAARVGDSYLDVIDSMTATHVDVVCDYDDLVLNVYPKGDLGSASGVTLSEGTHLTSYSEVVDGEFWNAVQGLWASGVQVRTDATSISTYGRRQTALSLANVSNVRAVNAILDAYLDAYSTPTTSLVAQLVQVSGAIAGVDFAVGDTLTVGATGVQSVGIVWELDEDGQLEASCEFDTLVAVSLRAKQRAIDRQIEKYDAPATAAPLDVGTKITSGKTSTGSVSWSWAGDVEETLPAGDPDKLWQPWRPEKTFRLYRIEAEINEEDLPDATDDTVIELHKNGSLLNVLYNVTLDTSTARDRASIFGLEVVDKNDRLSPSVSATGNHVDGRITLYYADAV